MSELLRKIAKGEGQTLDFKFRIEDQKKIARTLCAFANSDGGSLLIGVKDNGKIAGTNPEEEYFMIEGAADLYTKPPVNVESSVWQEGHHLVLEIIVPKSEVKHKAIDESGKWRSFVRVDDNTRMGNKILDRVWNLQNSGAEKPEAFDEDTMNIIKSIREEGPLSISKLYRLSNLRLKRVDQILSVLIYWNVIEMILSETGTTYRVPE